METMGGPATRASIGMAGTMLLALVLCAASAAGAAVDYATQVKPILAARCVMCHGGLKQKAGLRLDAAQLIVKGGKHGAVVVPGKSAESLLVHAISGGTNGASKMPEEGDPLKPEEIALIRQWIDEGAKFPADEPIPTGPESHWAFKPPARATVPVVKNAAWVRNPIDAFVAAEHEKRGLSPRPEADKHVLLRRVTLDLTGLPPTRAELHAFLADTSPDAYEKVVDRLLASRAYGQRWARHWMDVWRYSDWVGYDKEIRGSQPHVWRWRDWIVESLNADKPYDQMVREMIAGDEIAPADPSVLRATGFLVRSWSLYNRNGWMDEVVEHTSKAMLGLTLNCAKCHDHFYDPLTQREYYQFRAVFEPYDVRLDPVAGGATIDTKVDGVARVCDGDEKRPTYLFVRGDDRNPKKDEPLPPTVPAALGGKYEVTPVQLPAVAYYPGLWPHVRKGLRDASDTAVATAEKTIAQNEATIATAQSAYQALTTAPQVVATTKPAFIDDNFLKPQPQVWKPVFGEWKYEGGKLYQTMYGGITARMSSLAAHPADFSATVRFTITGGSTYKSVGLSFDVADDGDEQAVYLSAHAPGPAAATFYTKANQPIYDGGAKLALPVKLSERYELRVDVRGQLANVYVNGQLALAYKLPRERQAGRFSIFTHDAMAEFTGVRIDALPEGVKLAERVEKPPTTIASIDPGERAVKVAADLWMAHETVAISKLKLEVARAERAALDAKIAADDAKYATPASPDAEKLALAAGRAERWVAVCNAELETRRAQHALSVARASLNTADAKTLKSLNDATAKLVAQQTSLDAAKANLDKPSAQYAGITKAYPPTSTGRRTALAKWLTARDNPLPARVAINHIWSHHFGVPLVATVFDFGLNGKQPTHPQLLDWLAVDLIDHGWGMKSIHRMMVTSATYRMRSDSASPDDANKKLDPDNVYLWRANLQRMEAEIVRDGLLAVSGHLDVTPGGPDLDYNDGLKIPRRSLYFRHAYEKQMMFLRIFDAASPNECYRRQHGVMPQQALALANSPIALAESRRLAAKLAKEIDEKNAGTRSPFITAAFEQVLTRPPTEAERVTCEQFLSEQTKRLSDAKSLTPFTSGEASSVPPSKDPAQRARENLVHVLMNHNDFVNIR